MIAQVQRQLQKLIGPLYMISSDDASTAADQSDMVSPPLDVDVDASERAPVSEVPTSDEAEDQGSPAPVLVTSPGVWNECGEGWRWRSTKDLNS